MSESVYAFRRSTSQTSEADIISVMNNMTNTIDAIKADIDQLKPHWTAVEADRYFDAVTKISEGARGMAEILEGVKGALEGTRTGTDKLREAIWGILQECN